MKRNLAFFALLVFMGLAAFAQTRENISIYVQSTADNSSHRSFFRDSFEAEIEANGFRRASTAADADYTLNLAVRQNIILKDDGTFAPASSNDKQFILQLGLFSRRDNVEIVAFPFLFTEMTEVVPYSSYLFYQISTYIPTSVQGNTPPPGTPDTGQRNNAMGDAEVIDLIRGLINDIESRSQDRITIYPGQSYDNPPGQTQPPPQNQTETPEEARARQEAEARARQEELARVREEERARVLRETQEEQARQERQTREEQARQDALAREEQARQEELARVREEERARTLREAQEEQARQQALVREEQARQQALAREEQARQQALNDQMERARQEGWSNALTQQEVLAQQEEQARQEALARQQKLDEQMERARQEGWSNALAQQEALARQQEQARQEALVRQDALERARREGRLQGRQELLDEVRTLQEEQARAMQVARVLEEALENARREGRLQGLQEVLDEQARTQQEARAREEALESARREGRLQGLQEALEERERQDTLAREERERQEAAARIKALEEALKEAQAANVEIREVPVPYEVEVVRDREVQIMVPGQLSPEELARIQALEDALKEAQAAQKNTEGSKNADAPADNGDKKDSGNSVAEDPDAWRNKRVYFRASADVPVGFFISRQTSTLENNIMPGATLGLEFHLFNSFSMEMDFVARLADKAWGFNPGAALQIKFPFKPGANLMVEPYLGVAFTLNNAPITSTLFYIEAGGGFQLGFKAGPGALFFDVNFMHTFNNVLSGMIPAIPEITTSDALWNRFVIGVGIGYKIGFGDRAKK